MKAKCARAIGNPTRSYVDFDRCNLYEGHEGSCEYAPCRAKDRDDWCDMESIGPFEGHTCGVKSAPIDFATLQRVGLARCDDVFGGIAKWSEAEWTNALAGEVGEACNLTKKRLRGDQPCPTDDDVMDELADVVIYAALCASKVGGDLGEAVRRKFNQVSEKRGSAIRL